jgi:hypothetical protein
MNKTFGGAPHLAVLGCMIAVIVFFTVITWQGSLPAMNWPRCVSTPWGIEGDTPNRVYPPVMSDRCATS